MTTFIRNKILMAVRAILKRADIYIYIYIYKDRKIFQFCLKCSTHTHTHTHTHIYIYMYYISNKIEIFSSLFLFLGHFEEYLEFLLYFHFYVYLFHGFSRSP